MKKQCAKVGCALKGIAIDPKGRENCVACGEPLKNDVLADLLGQVSDLFGGRFPK